MVVAAIKQEQKYLLLYFSFLKIKNCLLKKTVFYFSLRICIFCVIIVLQYFL